MFMRTVFTVLLNAEMTNLSQEEQRFRKVSGNFLLQVKGHCFLCFFGGKHWMTMNHKTKKSNILKADQSSSFKGP